jgi:AraC-like DNA-binding protein
LVNYTIGFHPTPGISAVEFKKKKDPLKFYIKNMVSPRCKMTVKDQLEKLGLHIVELSLGEADIQENLTVGQQLQIGQILLQSGLEVLTDKKSILIQKIKNTVISIVHYSEEPLAQNLSIYLSTRLDYDYTYLSNVFSEELGITIEKFYISHKIERAKELLLYDELSLTQIAFKLHYKDVAHLSNQFKKVTGITPSRFKKQGAGNRFLLEDI